MQVFSSGQHCTHNRNGYIKICITLLKEDSAVSEQERRSRVVIRIGELVVELEGEHTNVENLMGKPLFDFIQGLQKVTGELPSVAIPEVPKAEPKEFPPQLGRPSNMSEALSTLFKKDWGRKPRTLAEIMEVLEINGLYYKKAAVATQLVYMMRKQEVRRFGKRRSYKYVAT